MFNMSHLDLEGEVWGGMRITSWHEGNFSFMVCLKKSCPFYKHDHVPIQIT